MDADQLYDLPRAGRLLLESPGRLRRLALTRRIPWTTADGRMRVPRAWVDAQAGRAPADGEALRLYWNERLAPASRTAGRSVRDRTRLPADRLLPAEEAARRIAADRVRLAGLDARGVLPALRVDGETVYDADLVDLLAREDEPAGDDAKERTDVRRAEVAGWSRWEYVTDLDRGRAPPPAATRPAPKEVAGAAPRAWTLPDDLAPRPEPEPDAPPRRILEADGFEVVEDE